MQSSTDPFEDLNTIFGKLPRRNPTARNVPVDAYRRGDDVWVHIDLPGVDSDDIEIELDRDVLTVRAQRADNADPDDRIYRVERPSGPVRQQVQLGDGLDSDRITADYEAGVLTLRIPLAERAKQRLIPVGGSAVSGVEAVAA